MPVAGTVHEYVDQRVAKGRDFDALDGTPGDGQTLMWAQVPSVIESETHQVDATTLAILGDFVPMGVLALITLPLAAWLFRNRLS
jgi:hypothetical protein